MKRYLLKLMAMCFLFVMTFNVISMAKNNRDTTFDFTLGVFQKNSYTSNRTKEDRSSAYSKCSYVGKGRIRVWLQRNTGVNVTEGGDYLLGGGDTVCIRNNAYERYGRCSVRLVVETERPQAVRINTRGVWSPDSIGCAP
ncbi:MAG: hypothetical protein Q4P28_02825 [Tissierellia bacterium]|nr:hypothetical protein [Tissierellia bacterium]